MNIKTTLFCIPLIALVGGGVALIACSSSDATAPATDATAQAQVVGAVDSHCGTNVVTVRQAACTEPQTDETDAGDTAADGGGGTGDSDGGAAGGDDYGPTLYNSEGDDDDCKYHVKWKVDAIGENKTSNFTVIATTKVDNAPLKGSPISAEVFLSDTHPAPNSGQKTVETTPGTYTVGPILFDASGKWTVRFHFHEECNDHDDSPHGHAAFYVQVP